MTLYIVMIFIYFGLLLLLQGYYLIAGMIKKDKKYITLFNSTFIGVLISMGIIFIVVSFSKFDSFSTLFKLIIVFTITLSLHGLLGIINLIIKSKNNYIDISKEESSKIFKNNIIFMIIFCIISIITGIFIINIIQRNNIEKSIKEYLYEKYDEKNFKIIKIEKDFSNMGMIDRYFSGYDVTITSPSTGKIILDLDEDDYEIYDEREYKEY